MTPKLLDLPYASDKLSSRLVTIRCQCGKKIGRGLGFFELICRHRNNHNGDRVLVLGEASREGNKIFSVSPVVIQGVTPDVGV